MAKTKDELAGVLEQHGQAHVLNFWDDLSCEQREALAEDVEQVDFALMDRLIRDWVLSEPPAEHFDSIEPVPVIPVVDPDRADAKEALDAGEEALRQGRVGVFLVAGGQGTRLGYDGPKGAYPIGPVSKRSLFAFHAEKIHNLQERYGCTLPWYIMVSDTNEGATRAFFRDNGYFGLDEVDIKFFRQRMVPCIDDAGKFMLAERYKMAKNPNGHGGCLPALIDNGILDDARARGIDTLSYFQVDNWAVRLVDPYFIGYHILRGGDMSSKNHLKTDAREAVGVHCLCDGEYRVIEYSELDIYPQLLNTRDDGSVEYNAGNPAIHVLGVDFVERVCRDYDKFPWHRAHKKIPYVDAGGETISPDEPNGYKFETFVFDALRFISHEPVALAIERAGEYTPIKAFEGANSVVAAWRSQAEYWGGWLEAAGRSVPRGDDGEIRVKIEISPQFAWSRDQFLKKLGRLDLPESGDIAIGPQGEVLSTSD